jgi:hypothetical protein
LCRSSVSSSLSNSHTSKDFWTLQDYQHNVHSLVEKCSIGATTFSNPTTVLQTQRYLKHSRGASKHPTVPRIDQLPNPPKHHVKTAHIVPLHRRRYSTSHLLHSTTYVDPHAQALARHRNPPHPERLQSQNTQRSPSISDPRTLGTLHLTGLLIFMSMHTLPISPSSCRLKTNTRPYASMRG